jgi:hypothetical protein
MLLEVYDNIFSYDFVVNSHSEALALPWNYTNVANRFQYPYSSKLSKGSHLFFGNRLYEKKGIFNIRNECPEIFLEVIEHFVSKILQDNIFNLHAIDTNLQIAGQDGTMHTDLDNGKSSFTALYYPVLDWKEEYGGALEFYSDDEKIIDRIFPAPGRIVLFDTKIKHRALAPVISNIARISISYRLFKNET